MGALFFLTKYFLKLAALALDVLAGVHLDFFHAADFGGSEHSEKRYMKCTFCLSLVGLLHQSELELPAINGWSR